MKIIQVAWLGGKPVGTIQGYGGIERMVATLTRELIRQGHEVVLIAPVGSHIQGATTVETSDFDKAFEVIQSMDFDIVHSHECWALNSVARRLSPRHYIATTHVMHAIGFSRNVVYLSRSQRESQHEQLRYAPMGSPVVYVPIDPALVNSAFTKDLSERYLLYLGMVAEQKGVYDAAIVAAELGMKLKVAGPAWGTYADRLKRMPYVEFVGEVDGQKKAELINNAVAVMCLHNDYNGWLEPGCGVVGEANAFDTPVAAFPNGCLAEQVYTGKNGWLGTSTDEIVHLMKNVVPSSPKDFALQHWSAEKIVKQYIQLYERAKKGQEWL